MSGCVSQCHQINHCYNSHNPPSTTGCSELLTAYLDCRANQPIVAPHDDDLNRDRQLLVQERKVGWSREGGCFLRTSQDSRLPQVQSILSKSSSTNMKECIGAVDELVSNFYGVTRGTISGNTDFRVDLGASEEELTQLTKVLGLNFGVTVSDDVVAHLRTVNDVAKCVYTAASDS